MHDKYSAKAHRYFEQSHINFKQKLILYFNATQSHPNILQILLLIIIKDLFCIFRENTHEQAFKLIQAKILYQCPSRNILDFVYGGSHFSTGVIFLRVRHVKNRPLWHFFYTWDTFFYGQGSFLYDEKWPLGRFSTGVVIRRYTGF